MGLGRASRDVEICHGDEPVRLLALALGEDGAVEAGKLTGPSAWDGYVACVAADALNRSRGTCMFRKIETIEKPELYQ